MRNKFADPPPDSRSLSDLWNLECDMFYETELNFLSNETIIEIYVKNEKWKLPKENDSKTGRKIDESCQYLSWWKINLKFKRPTRDGRVSWHPFQKIFRWGSSPKLCGRGLLRRGRRWRVRYANNHVVDSRPPSKRCRLHVSWRNCSTIFDAPLANSNTNWTISSRKFELNCVLSSTLSRNLGQITSMEEWR